MVSGIVSGWRYCYVVLLCDSLMCCLTPRSEAHNLLHSGHIVLTVLPCDMIFCVVVAVIVEVVGLAVAVVNLRLRF